jgi:hypothetical protein
MRAPFFPQDIHRGAREKQLAVIRNLLAVHLKFIRQ